MIAAASRGQAGAVGGVRAAELLSRSAQAAAGAYSAVAGIPVVGPVLAPIAAATAFGAVAAFDSPNSRGLAAEDC